MKPRRIALTFKRVAPAVAAAVFGASPASSAAEAASTYVGRPIYSDPSNGLQLPPGCIIEPTWRLRISPTEMEVWVLNCDSVARVWLLTRHPVEMLSAHEARLRFEVVDERVLPGETPGESLSVQCTAAGDDAGRVVRGARWRGSGHELHLAGAQGALRVDVTHRRLVDTDMSGIDCVRFPDREAMMRKLQQPDRVPR
ncbi:MAG TPA: hypothetical protein VNW98_06760 [Burkholderiaceae bacterium]|nr:hypothetical protein [Burkholderiaceae bacterium]